MDSWSHAEILQLIGIVAASTASVIGGLITVLMQKLSHKISVIRLELNGRLNQLLTAAHYSGVVQERAAQDARDLAKSKLALTSSAEDGPE